MSQFRVSSPRFKDAICAFALIAVISILWSWVHGLRGFGDLQVPSGYGTDGLFFYALSKAYATGEIFPGLFKFVASLNAPFSAQWNDFPFGDFIYFPAGILAYVFGLSAGGWLYMLAVHVLAGLSFFVSTRVLGLDRRACMVGAVLFGLSPFLFYHSLVQATVFVCWHVPLLIVSALWCLDPSRLRLSLKQGFAFAIVSAVLAGFYNPYYWTMFLFLLAIIFAGAAYKRDWRHVLRIAVVGFMAVAGFLVFNGHALLFWYLYGRGNAFGRDLSGLVTWGLRLPDLITPVESRIGFYNSIFDNYRANYPQMLKGEAQMVYLGFVAMCGLVLLVGTSVVRVAARKFDRINDHFWIALAIFSYAVVGGINYLLGSFGFVLLRATNRHAVMLMAVGLLFVAQGISSIQNKRVLGTFAALLLIFGLYEQLPTAQSPAAKPHLARVTEDREVARVLEKELGPGAMVFQLPVHTYPETGEVYEMGDYDHFRPWLWTTTMRFSYGTMKGRGDADWQAELAMQSPERMLEELNRYGFSAVLINRTAYKDEALELKEAFEKLNYQSFIEQPSYFGFRLKPVANPVLPFVEPYGATYAKGFYGRESEGTNNFRWASGDAVIRIAPALMRARQARGHEPGKLRLTFAVENMGSRSVWVQLGEKTTLISSPEAPTRPVTLELERSRLPERMRFFSDKPGIAPGNGDPRKLAFRVINLKIDPIV